MTDRYHPQLFLDNWPAKHRTTPNLHVIALGANLVTGYHWHAACTCIHVVHVVCFYPPPPFPIIKKLITTCMSPLFNTGASVIDLTGVASRKSSPPRIPFVLGTSLSLSTTSLVDKESEGTNFLTLEAEIQDLMERVTTLESGQARHWDATLHHERPTADSWEACCTGEFIHSLWTLILQSSTCLYPSSSKACTFSAGYLPRPQFWLPWRSYNTQESPTSVHSSTSSYTWSATHTTQSVYSIITIPSSISRGEW